jgi:hypothetical protein
VLRRVLGPDSDAYKDQRIVIVILYGQFILVHVGARAGQVDGGNASKRRSGLVSRVSPRYHTRGVREFLFSIRRSVHHQARQDQVQNGNL